MDSRLYTCFENEPYVNRSSVVILVMIFNCDDKCMHDKSWPVSYHEIEDDTLLAFSVQWYNWINDKSRWS